jgi:peptide deformylase
MILPIYTYGEKVLNTSGEMIDSSYPELSAVIENMFETMRQANGIGLAAQQIGLNIKLFVVDLTDYSSVDEELKEFKKVFINSEIIELSDETMNAEEGCLSFPGIYFTVQRPIKVKLRYLDENFEQKEEWFEGLPARCIQHEHDHTEGVTFLKYMSPIRKNMMQNKLKNLLTKNFNASFRVKK